jgi:hypothetical protein
MVPEVYQVFWAGMAAGEFINDAAIAAGSYRKQGSRRLAVNCTQTDMQEPRSSRIWISIRTSTATQTAELWILLSR